MYMNNTVIFSAVELCEQLHSLLAQLSEEQYIAPLDLFSQSSIGQHTRHIIEFYQCLSKSSKRGVSVCYEDRKRNILIEQDLWQASLILSETTNWLKSVEEPFKKMNLLVKDYQNNFIKEWDTPTTLAREIHHCNEHSVHHLAIIKIGLKHYFPYVKSGDQIGVAKSTTAFIKEQKPQH